MGLKFKRGRKSVIAGERVRGLRDQPGRAVDFRFESSHSHALFGIQLRVCKRRGGVQTYSNTTDVAIPDNNLLGASSSIVVAGRVGKAPADASVTVNIVHPYKGDLKVDLIAPDGSIYVLHNRIGGDGDNVAGTVKLNLSSENLNGTWKLRAVDRGPLDVVKIDSWSLEF